MSTYRNLAYALFHVAAVCLLLLPISCAYAEGVVQKRIALLIGNRAYGPGVGALTNPLKDIDTVASALEKIGFKVIKSKDAGRAEMMKQLSQFAEEVSTAGKDGVGFFYYSGHGVSRPRDGINYLIPVDVRTLQNENFWWDAISLDVVLREFEKGAPEASFVVVFDACRSELRIPTKSAVKGFEPITDKNGVFIAFSTSPNTVASDVGEDAGPYASILASELVRPGQDHLTLFQNVKERVFSTTKNAQRPWENNGLLQRLYFAGRPPSLPVPSQEDDAKRVWDTFGQKSTDQKFLEDFISHYGQTTSGESARRKLADLRKIAGRPPEVPDANKSRKGLSSTLVLAIIPNSPTYAIGELIKIKIVAASSHIKAFAVFPFGPKERSKIEASYNVSEGGLYIPYKVPVGSKPGIYRVAVYVQEIQSKLEERHEIEVELKG
jgi:hypothetical protein